MQALKASLLSQLLPMWVALRAKIDRVLDIDSNAVILQGIGKEKIMECFDKRFKKNYSTAWAAATYLDPLNWQAATSENHFTPADDPTYKTLVSSYMNDVAEALKEMAPRDDWSALFSEKEYTGVEDYHVIGFQHKETREGGPQFILPTVFRRRLWTHTLKARWPLLSNVAERLLSMHGTSCGPERNWSEWRWVYRPNRCRLHVERAEKMLVVKSHASLQSKNFTSLESKDMEYDLADF